MPRVPYNWLNAAVATETAKRVPVAVVGKIRQGEIRVAYEVQRRKVFISFFQGDRPEVEQFIDRWATRESVFIPKAIGVTNGDDFFASNNAEYVMHRVRDAYLGDSTVTLVLIGRCTHSRRYVDWEIKSSLRQGAYTPNGLLGILLPSSGESAHLPERFAANWGEEEAKFYARYRFAPKSADELRSWIEDAQGARTSRATLIRNVAEMMGYNAKCRVCGLTH